MLALHKPRSRAILIIVFVAVVPSILAWLARSDPGINFLSRDARAEWIVFPTAVNSRARGSASFDATFRRDFVLPDPPPTARLSFRAMRRANIKINGAPILSQSTHNLKLFASVEFSQQLCSGTIVLVADW